MCVACVRSWVQTSTPRRKKQREKIQPPLLIGKPDGETGTGELGAGEWGGVSLGLYHSTPEASKFKFSICSATVILIHRH